MQQNPCSTPKVLRLFEGMEFQLNQRWLKPASSKQKLYTVTSDHLLFADYCFGQRTWARSNNIAAAFGLECSKKRFPRKTSSSQRKSDWVHIGILYIIFLGILKLILCWSEKGPPIPGVSVALRRKNLDPYDEPQYGERVPYVILRGDPSARLYERAAQPEELLSDG